MLIIGLYLAEFKSPFRSCHFSATCIQNRIQSQSILYNSTR
uniref:Uncharacterized protein n=1 Tax=Siphoviridae sp. ctJ3t72 TaxID=2826240 RepID=A0A8S5QNK4_9CAUD|nr:MAG TPA: hypothetical protein [Siphoviridae sp. ctJ3t72]